MRVLPETSYVQVSTPFSFCFWSSSLIFISSDCDLFESIHEYWNIVSLRNLLSFENSVWKFC